MNITFFEPLARAWDRMRLALFRPFDLHKWFVVGFTAFLAGLADGHNGSGGARGRQDMSFGDFLALPRKAWSWLTDHPGWLAAIVFIALFLVVLGIILLWLSSRGKFMFLDNVVHNRAEIAKPWREFRKEGDSLFLWRLVFSLIGLALFVLPAVFFFISANRIYEETRFSPLPILWILGMAAVFLLVLMAVSYISLFLNDFIVPLMFKNRVSATRGWRLFLPLLGSHPFHFLLYGLVVFALIIAFVVVVIVAGIITCCIGWLVLVIPYIGTVATLPFWYWLRSFGPEFLAQFGPEYDFFPRPVETSPGEPAS